MGELVSFCPPAVLRPHIGCDSGVFKDRPDMGEAANRTYEFFDFLPPPVSGFPVGQQEDTLLTLVFAPIQRMWARQAKKQATLALLRSNLEKTEQVRWAGKTYWMCQVMEAGIVLPPALHPQHVGKLCVQLVVREVGV